MEKKRLLVTEIGRIHDRLSRDYYGSVKLPNNPRYESLFRDLWSEVACVSYRDSCEKTSLFELSVEELEELYNYLKANFEI